MPGEGTMLVGIGLTNVGPERRPTFWLELDVRDPKPQELLVSLHQRGPVIIGDGESGAQHGLSRQLIRDPGRGGEVLVLPVVEVGWQIWRSAGEGVGGGPLPLSGDDIENRHVGRRVEWPLAVVPVQPQVDGNARSDLPLVVDEKIPQRAPAVLLRDDEIDRIVG